MFLCFFILAILSVSNLIAELQQPIPQKVFNRDDLSQFGISGGSTQRDIPDYEFLIDPINILENYYDYMPGSYYATPVQIEADGSVYIVFHARETESTTRRTYFAYLDAFGNLNYNGLIGIDDIHEGYPGIDLDPVTGTPFAAWHTDVQEPFGEWEVIGSYALYSQGNPDSWITPFVIFDDNTPSPNMPEDCFIWVEVHIGPSPDPDERRIYVIGRNTNSLGDPSENVLIAYADFDENDLNGQFDVDWNYNRIWECSTVMELETIIFFRSAFSLYLPIRSGGRRISF